MLEILLSWGRMRRKGGGVRDERKNYNCFKKRQNHTFLTNEEKNHKIHWWIIINLDHATLKTKIWCTMLVWIILILISFFNVLTTLLMKLTPFLQCIYFRNNARATAFSRKKKCMCTIIWIHYIHTNAFYPTLKALYGTYLQ